MKKILVIEDEDLIREAIQLILRINGFNVFVADNGAAGIALAKECVPDLVVSDIMMPEKSGYEVLEALRAYPPLATVPFLFLSAKADSGDIRQGMNLGADDYLTKPFEHDQLVAAVNTRLAKSDEIKKNAEQKLDNLRTNIAFSLPHEFLTPLNGILGITKMMRDNYDMLDREDAMEMFDEITISARRLHRVTENFLFYTRLEILSNDLQSMGDLLDEVTHSAEEIIFDAISSKSTTFNRADDVIMEVTDSPISILPLYFLKAVEELLDNALKFSEPNTKVLVKGAASGGKFILKIENKGRGMTPEQIASIGGYQQFERKQYEQQGNGLGLVITQKIMEVQGGSFAIDSIPNETTTAILTVNASKHRI
ncbi:MAG: response regulator [Ignavibacteria bacterium]|nr:response regulator [Ignavibacteria bacterium]